MGRDPADIYPVYSGKLFCEQQSFSLKGVTWIQNRESRMGS